MSVRWIELSVCNVFRILFLLIASASFDRIALATEEKDSIVLHAEDQLRLAPVKAIVVPITEYFVPPIDIGAINLEMLEREFATKNEFRGFDEDHSWKRGILETHTGIALGGSGLPLGGEKCDGTHGASICSIEDD